MLKDLIKYAKTIGIPIAKPTFRSAASLHSLGTEDLAALIATKTNDCGFCDFNKCAGRQFAKKLEHTFEASKHCSCHKASIGSQ